MSFLFTGKVPASKSLLNRALILKSFCEQINIIGSSHCDDVLLTQKALKDFLENKKQFYCGSAGTLFRFLSLRVSRKPGVYYLKADKQLLDRPAKELIRLLSQLSCQAYLDDQGLHINSKGWKLMGDGIHISAKQSSQFISAFLLSAWNLNFPCYLSLGENIFSKSYLKMTMDLCLQMGMQLNYKDQSPYEIFIPKNQKITKNFINIESDASSAFTLAALAAVNGSIKITDFPISSKQGDIIFVKYLKDIGVDIFMDIDSQVLSVKESVIFKTPFSGHPINLKNNLGFDLSLKSTPDLFPVLASLACLLTAESIFLDTSHIAYKESNRLVEIKNLLNLLGREVQIQNNSFLIKSWNKNTASPALNKEIFFDTKEDHRLVMAAYTLMAAGFKIKCSNTACLSKSFPELNVNF